MREGLDEQLLEAQWGHARKFKRLHEALRETRLFAGFLATPWARAAIQAARRIVPEASKQTSRGVRAR